MNEGKTTHSEGWAFWPASSYGHSGGISRSPSATAISRCCCQIAAWMSHCAKLWDSSPVSKSAARNVRVDGEGAENPGLSGRDKTVRFRFQSAIQHRGAADGDAMRALSDRPMRPGFRLVTWREKTSAHSAMGIAFITAHGGKPYTLPAPPSPAHPLLRGHPQRP
jgi:hypothetical protein